MSIERTTTSRQGVVENAIGSAIIVDAAAAGRAESAVARVAAVRMIPVRHAPPHTVTIFHAALTLSTPSRLATFNNIPLSTRFQNLLISLVYYLKNGGKVSHDFFVQLICVLKFALFQTYFN